MTDKNSSPVDDVEVVAVGTLVDDVIARIHLQKRSGLRQVLLEMNRLQSRMEFIWNFISNYEYSNDELNWKFQIYLSILSSGAWFSKDISRECCLLLYLHFEHGVENFVHLLLKTK